MELYFCGADGTMCKAPSQADERADERKYQGLGQRDKTENVYLVIGEVADPQCPVSLEHLGNVTDAALRMKEK